MKKEIFENLIQIVAPFVAFFLIWLKIKAIQWLNSKIKDQELKNTMNKVNNVIIDVVKEVEQQYASKERVQSIAGVLTPEAASKAKDLAVTTVVDQLGDKGMAEVKKVMDMNDSKANKLISSKIEAMVFDLKKVAIVLLPFMFISVMACSNLPKPVSVAAATIEAHSRLVTTSDDKTAEWYLTKDKKCLSEGIKTRDDELQVNHKPVEEAKKAAKLIYDNCMIEANNTANRVVELVEAIRAKDKVAATVALAVARKEKPVEALGYVVPEVINLIKQLEDVVKVMQ